MDSICLKNMGFFAFHGTTEEERSIGQRFFLDVEMNIDLQQAGRSDDIHQTVNYQKVYLMVEEIIQHKKYRLIEALASDIAERILARFDKVCAIKVWVRKPQVPLSGILDYVEVCVERTSEGGHEG